MRHNLVFLMLCLTAWTGLATAQVQPKPLAPGVLKVIPAKIDIRDSYSLPQKITGLDAEEYSPNFYPVLDTLHGQTKNMVFFRDVWQYEFAFLGLRQVELELPTADGQTSIQNVWYLVYRIRNTGQNLSYDIVQENQPVAFTKNQLVKNRADYEVKSKFVPHFYLNGWIKPEDGEYRSVSYRDQVAPESLRLIQQVEDNNRPLMDKVEMMLANFPVVRSADDGGQWGVAIWHGVDPNLDYISVTVRGLTNAFRISTRNGQKQYKYRNLQLNFWRPGDTVRQDDDEITYGIPLVDDPIRQIEICQRYRLPGPLIRGYLVSDTADQNVLIAELDAQVQFSDFQSSLTPELDQGTLPASIKSAFEDAGIEFGGDPTVNTLVSGKKWSLSGRWGGADQQLLLSLEPQYWEADGDGIRFIKSLDHLWIYR